MRRPSMAPLACHKPILRPFSLWKPDPPPSCPLLLASTPHQIVKKRIDLVRPRSIAPACAPLSKPFIEALLHARSCLIFSQPGLLRQFLRGQIATYSLVEHRRDQPRRKHQLHSRFTRKISAPQFNKPIPTYNSIGQYLAYQILESLLAEIPVHQKLFS